MRREGRRWGKEKEKGRVGEEGEGESGRKKEEGEG